MGERSLSCSDRAARPIAASRAKANNRLEQAKQGVNPKAALKENATAAGLTVKALSEAFMTEHVLSRELDSASKYANAFKTHIQPEVGERADLLTRDEVRKVMDKARAKRKRPKGQRGPDIGGVEAARTTMGVLRHMYSWAIIEGKVKRRTIRAA